MAITKHVYIDGKSRFFHTSDVLVKVVSHSIRTLELQLIPVSRQSARRGLSHKPGGVVPLLSARPAVTFPAAEHNHPLASSNLVIPPFKL